MHGRINTNLNIGSGIGGGGGNGGGGGGTIIIDKRLASADLLLAVEGGAAGLTTDGNLYGAEPGCVGAIRYRPLVGSASITPLIPAFLPSGAPQRRR